jgi:hypothetical protein
MRTSSKNCLIIFLLTLFQQTVSAQVKRWPVNYGSKSMNTAPVRKGFIVLASGDTLKGYIKVFPEGAGFYPILDTVSNEVQKVIVANIAMLRIYDESLFITIRISYDRPPYVDYINMPNSFYLWRLDGRRKDVAICDDVLKGGRINNLILVTPTERILLFKGGYWFLDHNIDVVLIGFINGRYKTGVSIANFTTTEDIIDYILDKEESLYDSLNRPQPIQPAAHN